MARIWIYWLRLHFKKDLFLNHPNIIYNLINFCSAMSTLFRRSLPLYCTFIINLRWKQSTKTKTFNLLEYFVRSSIKLFAIKPNERKSEWVTTLHIFDSIHDHQTLLQYQMSILFQTLGIDTWFIDFWFYISIYLV